MLACNLMQLQGKLNRDTNPSFAADIEGNIVSGFAGYRWAFGQYIVGAELDIALNGDGQIAYTEGGISPGENYDINLALRLGGKFGRELGGGLAYMGLGFAMLDVKLNREFDDQRTMPALGTTILSLIALWSV